MSRTFHHGERRIRVQGIRKDPPDLRRVARTLIALAQAQAEADAQQSDNTKAKTNKNTVDTTPVAAGTDTANRPSLPKRRLQSGDAL